MARSAQARQPAGAASDLAGSYSKKSSKKGTPNPAQENCGDLDICPDLIIAALAAAAAAAFVVLFTQITMAGRKKKRSSDGGGYSSVPFTTWLYDLSWHLGS